MLLAFSAGRKMPIPKGHSRVHQSGGQAVLMMANYNFNLYEVRVNAKVD